MEKRMVTATGVNGINAGWAKPAHPGGHSHFRFAMQARGTPDPAPNLPKTARWHRPPDSLP